MKDLGTVLIVDDEASICLIFSRALASIGIESEYCLDAKQARERIAHNKLMLVLIDVNMPIENGTSLAGWIANQYPELDFMMMSACTESVKDARCLVIDKTIPPRKMAEKIETRLRLAGVVKALEEARGLMQERALTHTVANYWKEFAGSLAGRVVLGIATALGTLTLTVLGWGASRAVSMTTDLEELKTAAKITTYKTEATRDEASETRREVLQLLKKIEARVR